eukprot:RCo000850
MHQKQGLRTRGVLRHALHNGLFILLCVHRSGEHPLQRWCGHHSGQGFLAAAKVGPWQGKVLGHQRRQNVTIGHVRVKPHRDTVPLRVRRQHAMQHRLGVKQHRAVEHRLHCGRGAHEGSNSDLAAAAGLPPMVQVEQQSEPAVIRGPWVVVMPREAPPAGGDVGDLHGIRRRQGAELQPGEDAVEVGGELVAVPKQLVQLWKLLSKRGVVQVDLEDVGLRDVERPTLWIQHPDLVGQHQALAVGPLNLRPQRMAPALTQRVVHHCKPVRNQAVCYGRGELLQQAGVVPLIGHGILSIETTRIVVALQRLHLLLNLW